MRTRLASFITAAAVALALAACGGDDGGDPVDARRVDAAAIDAADTDAPDIDAAVDAAIDATVDASVDAPIDAIPTSSELIGFARAALDGTVSLPISGATITYIKPQIGTPANDPAGFTIQASQDGPALMIAVDPATLTPAPAVGDVVSFTITSMGTTGGQRRATAIDVASYTRTATGTDINPLVKDLSAASDAVTAIDSYDSEVIDVTGTIAAAFASAGSGFEAAQITTAGVATASAGYLLRVPATFRDANDMVATCGFTLNNTPVGRFNAATQLAAFTAADITLTGCPAPVTMAAVATSGTTVQFTFSRNILPASVMADGSQFTFDNGLTASAAVVSGRTVTVTTNLQVGGTIYTATVAASVRDLQNTVMTAPGMATFTGFTTLAVVRINEFNAHITTGTCDLIELRVVSGGTMNGYVLRERDTAVLVTFANLNVATNDIIVVHMNGGNVACNPATATNETTGPAQQPAATHARNYDTAYDWYSTDAGLTDTDNVFTLLNNAAVIIDVVLTANAATGTAAAGSETAAAAAAAANQWQMVGGGIPAGGFVDDNFRAHAALDLDGTDITAAGTSIQRLDNTDDNDKDDWNTMTTTVQANTFGLINVGQTAF